MLFLQKITRNMEMEKVTWKIPEEVTPVTRLMQASTAPNCLITSTLFLKQSTDNTFNKILLTFEQATYLLTTLPRAYTSMQLHVQHMIQKKL